MPPSAKRMEPEHLALFKEEPERIGFRKGICFVENRWTQKKEEATLNYLRHLFHPGKRVLFWSAAGLLLGMHLILLLGVIHENDYVYDEPIHLASGRMILSSGDYTLAPESGVLPQIVGALMIPDQPYAKAALSAPAKHAPTPFVRAGEILFCSDAVPPRMLLLRARLPMAVFSLLCGLLILILARRFGGTRAGLLTLALYCVTPLYLANGALAVSDMAVSLGFLGTLYCFGLLMRTVSVRNLLFAGCLISCLFLSKMSAILIVPILLGMVCHAVLSPKRSIRLRIPFRSEGFPIRLEGRQTWYAMMSVLALLFAMLLISVWCAYGFQISYPNYLGLDQVRLASGRVLPVEGPIPLLLKIVRADLWLPHGYLYGFLSMAAYSESAIHWSFLDGTVYEHGGNILFYPLVFFYKTPPPLILSYGLAMATWVLMWCHRACRKRLVYLWPYAAFALLYSCMAMNSTLQIGYRHLMPALTVAFPLIGLGFRWLFMWAGRDTVPRWRRFVRWIPLVLVLWCAAESIWVYPHSLSYFSSMAGGAGNAYRHVVDSSLDWGQDVRNVSETLKAHGIPQDGSVRLYTMYLSGLPTRLSDLPNARNLRFTPPGMKDPFFEFEPGYYLVSATRLQRGLPDHIRKGYLRDPGLVYSLKTDFYEALDGIAHAKAPSPAMTRRGLEYQAFRFDLLRSAMRRMEPVFTINHSILVYRLNEDQIKKTLKDLIR